MKDVYYKVISGKLTRDIKNPDLDSNEHLFNEGTPLDMRGKAVRKIKDFFDVIVTDGKDEFQKIPTKDELVDKEFKNEVVHFFEIRFVNGDEEHTIYSTLKNSIDTEGEIFDGLLQETLWYKTNGFDVPIYEFKKPFNGFLLQADFDFIGARLKTIKQTDEEKNN